MAMGIVDSSVLDAELSTLTNFIDAKTIEIKHGRGNTNEVPSTLRKLVAQDSIAGVKASEIADAFDISKSSISAYKNGATSTSSYDNPDKELKSHVDSVKTEIASSARSKIIAALSHITENKLSDAKLSEVSMIAKDMATVMEKMEGNTSKDKTVQHQVIIYAPRVRDENDYNVIDVQ